MNAYWFNDPARRHGGTERIAAVRIPRDSVSGIRTSGTGTIWDSRRSPPARSRRVTTRGSCPASVCRSCARRGSQPAGRAGQPADRSGSRPCEPVQVFGLVSLAAAAVACLVTIAPVDAQPGSTCGLTNPAFCDTFNQPSAVRGRAGDLNPGVSWTVGRLAPQDFSGFGPVANPVATAPVPACLCRTCRSPRRFRPTTL